MILVTNNEGTVGVPTTARMLAAGAGALDAIEAGIRLIEADPAVRTVGRGGWPNLICELELDACVMDGTTLRTGAVGALKGYLHPVSVAREIMRRLPHEFLVGEGAARFAHEIGAPTADNLIEDSRRVWREWFDRTLTPAQKQAWPDIPLAELCRHAIDPETGGDTTVFLAQDHGRQYLFRHQHLRLGLEISRPAGRQPDHRRRFLRRHAVWRGGLHRRGRNDHSLLHRALDRSLHETRRHGRRRGAGSGRGHARAAKAA